MDRGDWRAIVSGVPKSRTLLSNYAEHNDRAERLKRRDINDHETQRASRKHAPKTSKCSGANKEETGGASLLVQ